MLMVILLILRHMRGSPKYDSFDKDKGGPSLFTHGGYVSNSHSMHSNRSSPHDPPSRGHSAPVETHAAHASHARHTRSERMHATHSGVITGGSPLTQSFRSRYGHMHAHHAHHSAPSSLLRQVVPATAHTMQHSMPHSAQSVLRQSNPGLVPPVYSPILPPSSVSAPVVTPAATLEDDVKVTLKLHSKNQDSQPSDYSQWPVPVLHEPHAWPFKPQHPVSASGSNSSTHATTTSGQGGAGGVASLGVHSQRGSMHEYSPGGHTSSTRVFSGVSGEGRDSIEDSRMSSLTSVLGKAMAETNTDEDELQGALRTMKEELAEEQLEIFALLGRGAFGYVYHGVFQPHFCIKTFFPAKIFSYACGSCMHACRYMARYRGCN